MIDNKKAIKYPKLLGRRYLIDYLEELGFATTSGMGDKQQISFLEIESFMRATRIDLSHWDVLALRRLSLEYIIQLQKKEAYEAPPYIDISEGQYLKQTAISSKSVAHRFGFVL